MKCDYCDKIFNRCDNFESHLELHAEPDRKKTKRVEYSADAARKLEELRMARSRKSTKPGSICGK